MSFGFDKQVTLVIVILIISLFGMSSIAFIANTEITFKIEMDQETREYLEEHDYCFHAINPPYSSEDPAFLFWGDCGYLNTTVMTK